MLNHGGDAMSTMHDNGRVGKQPDMRELIDQAGAVTAAAVALIELVDRAAIDNEVTSMPTFNALLNAANDVREARWYLRRALHSLRSLS